MRRECKVCVSPEWDWDGSYPGSEDGNVFINTFLDGKNTSCRWASIKAPPRCAFIWRLGFGL